MSLSHRGADDLSEQAARTRRAILAAAEHCFVECGPDGASTRSIAKRAGVTQPLVLHYFGSKERLFTAVIDEAFARLAEAQSLALNPAADDLIFIVHGLRGLFRHTGQDRALLRLATWARLTGRLPVTAATSAFWAQVAGRLLGAQSRGILRQELELGPLLLSIDSAIKGFWERRNAYLEVTSKNASADPTALAAEFDASVEETLLSLLLRGMLNPAYQDEALRLLRCH